MLHQSLALLLDELLIRFVGHFALFTLLGLQLSVLVFVEERPTEFLSELVQRGLQQIDDFSVILTAIM